MPTPDASLNLSVLLRNDPSEYEVAGSGELTPVNGRLAELGLELASPLSWELTARSTGGDDDFILEGSVSGTASMECRRCLEPTEVSASTSFIYPMIYRPNTAGLSLIELDDDNEDTLVFGQPEVDFSDLLLQVFTIDLPLTALCKENCKGLSADGVNLNEHPDQVSQEEAAQESPFAVLKDLEL